MPTPLETAARYREELLKQDAASLGRLARAYHNSFKMLEGQVEALITEANNKGLSGQRLYKAKSYQALMEQITQQLRDMEALTRNEINEMTRLSIKLGIDHSNGLIAAVMGDERLQVAFNKLNPEVVKSLLGFLEPDSNLYQRLGQLSEVSTERIATDFINGVNAGWNPVKISKTFLTDWGMALTDSMRMTRTAQLYSYREATRANYIANQDIVDGWYWCAELSPETCDVCIALDGTWHSNDETLNDHYNGRCAMIPAVKGFPRTIEEGRGQEWFEDQPESVQRDMLGKGKYEAWKDGKFEFNQLPKEVDDKTYGKMKSGMTLKELVGEE